MKEEQLKRLEKMTAQQRRDEFFKFVIFFNEFINHKTKEKRTFIEKDMRF